MQFWQIAFMYKWVTADQLKLAVKTDTNPFGEITKEQYKEITRQEFKTQAEAQRYFYCLNLEEILSFLSKCSEMRGEDFMGNVKWEYQTYTWDSENAEILINELNRLGEEYWEVVTSVPKVTGQNNKVVFVLKRTVMFKFF